MGDLDYYLLSAVSNVRWLALIALFLFILGIYVVATAAVIRPMPLFRILVGAALIVIGVILAPVFWTY